MLKVNEMVKKRTALGQGLSALIPVDEPDGSKNAQTDVAHIPIDSLVPNPFQPRRLFSQESLSDLSNSIKEIGVIQPLIVRSKDNDRYEIVAGERRWRAAKMAGFSSVPVVVREVSDAESLEIALIENLQRENLNPLDTAQGYETLIQKFAYTHENLALRIGKDRSNITNHLRLLKLPDSIKDDLRNERLSMGHARTLLAVDHLPTQLNLSRRIVRRKLTVRELERIISNLRKKQAAIHESAKAVDPELADLQKGLSRFFSTKVILKKHNNNSGKLEFHFHSAEELDRLLSLLGYREDFS